MDNYVMKYALLALASAGVSVGLFWVDHQYLGMLALTGVATWAPLAIFEWGK